MAGTGIILANLAKPDFGYVVLAAAGISLHVVLTGFKVGGARGKAFDKEFYEKKETKALLDEHKKATGEEKLPQGGYPDMGNGRYSDLLSYSKWLSFNNAQRAHQNYIEGAATIITVLLLSGATWNPRYAAILGGVYALGREVYSWGYVNKGANGRLVGAILFDVALLALVGTSFYGGARIAGLIKA